MIARCLFCGGDASERDHLLHCDGRQGVIEATLGERFDSRTLVIAPSPHAAARETSALAAVSVQPLRGKQNTVILKLITAAGPDGMSDDELHRATGYLRATICARRHDLAGFITAGVRRAMSPSGRPMTTWRRKTAEEMHDVVLTDRSR